MCTSMDRTPAPPIITTSRPPTWPPQALRPKRPATAIGFLWACLPSPRRIAASPRCRFNLAVNRQGALRGNYTDTVSDQNQPVHGSVDKSTQRIAFTVGDNTRNVVETGLYNLTKDEAPALIHFGSDRTEQWLFVRLNSPDAAQNQPD
jgi:hypothetical protein